MISGEGNGWTSSTFKGTEVLLICNGILYGMASGRDHAGVMKLQEMGEDDLGGPMLPRVRNDKEKIPPPDTMVRWG